MARQDKTVDVYREERNGSVEVVPVLFFGAALISFAFVLAVHYYWGMDMARYVLLGVAGAWAVAGIVAGVIFVAYKFLGLGGKLINDHQQTDDDGEGARMAIMFDGVSGLISANAQNERNTVNAQKAGLQWSMFTQREAARLLEERQAQVPAADDTLLKQLFGGDDALLLTDGEDD